MRVYVKGAPRQCGRRIGDFATLTSSLCECSGYVPIEGSLADAGFAQPDAANDDEPLPALRVVRR